MAMRVVAFLIEYAEAAEDLAAEAEKVRASMDSPKRRG